MMLTGEIDEASKVDGEPDDVMNKWGVNPRYSKVFEDLLEAARAELGYAEPLQSTAVVGNESMVNKRKGSMDPEIPPKKPKVDSVVAVDALPSNLLATVKLQLVKPGIMAKVFMGGKVAIINVSAEVTTLKRGLCLFGFGKVTWKKMNEDEAGDMTKQILVEFKSRDDEVVLERQLLTLHKATWCLFEPGGLGVEGGSALTAQGNLSVRCIRITYAKYTSTQICSSLPLRQGSVLFPWVVGSDMRPESRIVCIKSDKTHVGPA